MDKLTDEKKLIVALDYPDSKSAMEMLEKLDPEFCRVKVGKELFTRSGPELVRRVHAEGFDVFLDLKFHDIPNTVAKAVQAAAELGVWMVNVHASGGSQMMSAAKKAISVTGSDTLLIAVTVLTSMSQSDLNEIGLDVAIDQQVLRLARLAERSGLDGVVCSAREAMMLRAALSEQFLLVTPGIRPAGDVAADQKRVETPASAIAKGSNYLVIGRPVTQALDPIAKLQSIANEIKSIN